MDLVHNVLAATLQFLDHYKEKNSHHICALYSSRLCSTLRVRLTSADDRHPALPLRLEAGAAVPVGEDLVGEVVAGRAAHDVQAPTREEQVQAVRLTRDQEEKERKKMQGSILAVLSVLVQVYLVLLHGESGHGLRQQADHGDDVPAEARAVHVRLDVAVRREVQHVHVGQQLVLGQEGPLLDAPDHPGVVTVPVSPLNLTEAHDGLTVCE